MTMFLSALSVRQSPTKLVLAIVEILRLVVGEGAISGRPTSAKLRAGGYRLPSFDIRLA